MKGRLITFEGPEGSGKSTHIQQLAEDLRARGIPVRLTREPGGTSTGEIIRGLLQHEQGGEPLSMRAEVLLFCASRAQLAEQVIRPALDAGEWVLCDRFTDSTLAYQGYGRGFPLETLRALNAFALGDLCPDLTLLLDLDPQSGQDRLRDRQRDGHPAPDRIERETLAFHARLREGFLELARLEPERFRVFDTRRPRQVVAAAIREAVNVHFGLPPGHVQGACTHG